jgi:chemotaxis protein CheD
MVDSKVVGIADYKFSEAPDTLVTFALGSCVGVVLYDRADKIGGLAHVMLPSSTLMPGAGKDERMKFADTAIADMLRDMERAGAHRSKLSARIAGGANMFNAPIGTSMASIGENNVESVKRVLKELGIPLEGEDTGGFSGRTVSVDLENGKMQIRSLGSNIQEM